MSLIENAPKHTQKPFLVFSSVGRYAQVESWLKGKRNFDIWLTHYADDRSPFEQRVEFLNYRKGGKWPNLKYAMDTWPEIFRRYRAVWVVDDDIALAPRKINALFKMVEQYDLSIAQPAFDLLGKNSHRICEEKPGHKLRYTNFVENNVPIIRIDVLESFMQVYDPRLIGWGVDWWMMHHLGDQVEGKVAIIDRIRCYNPDDGRKGGRREIGQLQAKEARIRVFEEVKQEHGISVDQLGHKTFSVIREKNIGFTLFRLFGQKYGDRAKRKIRWTLQKYGLWKPHWSTKTLAQKQNTT